MTSPTTKPALLPLDVAQIPADLTALPQWVLWKLEWDHGRNAWTKVPYAPNGAHASTNRRATWSPFDAAVAAYGQGGNFHGIGFVLDGQSDLVGFDLDKLKEHVHQSAVGEIYRVLQASGTYIERSPSGKGLRAFLRGKLPFSGKNCRTLGVEVYRADRYLTITGHWLKDTGAAIVADQQAIDDIVGLAFPPMPPAPALAQTTAPISQGLSDADILNRAAAAKNGKDFNLLWAGDCRAYFLHRKLPVASQSEADLALCQILAFWSGRNAAQMDRLFRQSDLMRP